MIRACNKIVNRPLFFQSSKMTYDAFYIISLRGVIMKDIPHGICNRESQGEAVRFSRFLLSLFSILLLGRSPGKLVGHIV
jgi:hypothetical protein